ncbi:hemagglutinin [Opitutaceae bacterium TAV5]|nr:hemagglutinin [Opitutaceae bacterium TAV5]
MTTKRTTISLFMKTEKQSFTRGLLASVLSGLMAVLPSMAYARPTGGKVVAGEASISSGGNTTTINQLTNKAIIDWQQFGINANEAVRFLQPGAASVILNRVTGADASKILGALSANGRVFLLNPNGILFGPGSRVDVAGLMASTLGIRNEDFMAGNYTFTQDPAAQLAYVVNHGRITVADNGFAWLVAPGVENAGIIVAKGGHVALASGKQAYVDFSGDGLVKFRVSGKITEKVIGPDGEPMSSSVSNTGALQAHGGQVLLSGDTARDIVSSVVNNTGVIEANSLADLTGSVQLLARNEGDVLNSGTITVSSAATGSTAGAITLAGENVGQFGTLAADAAGQGDAGSIDLRATHTVAVGSASTTTANAGQQGDGGTILVVGEHSARIGTGAALQARGGALFGDGGFIETSGYRSFEIGAAPDVSAPNGLAGTWLIDPANIEIVSGNTNTNITGTGNPFSSSADTAELGIDNLLTALGTGNVTITTGNVGTQDGSITLSTALAYTGTNDRTLTLNAHNSIFINQAISSGTNKLNLALNAGSNAGGGTGNANGSVTIAADITTNGGSLTTTGKDFTQSSGVLSTGAGAITFNNTGAVALNGSLATTGNFTVANAGGFSFANAIDTGAGNISITTAGGINVAHDLTTTGTASLTATTGHIAGPGLLTADTLNLETRGAQNASIGKVTYGTDGGGNETITLDPLKISAGTLNASTKSGTNGDTTSTGNIIITNTGAGDLTLGAITTNGDRSDTDIASVVITTRNGALKGSGGGTHVDAWSATLDAKNDIGSLNTRLTFLTASTQTSGSITLNNTSDTLYIRDVTVREYGNAALLTEAGDIKAYEITGGGSTPATTTHDGTKDIRITSSGNIGIYGNISATREVDIESTAGSILNVPTGSATGITSNTLKLSAGKGIGQNGNALTTITGGRINATASDGGVYLQEANRLTIGTITASGTDNDVGLAAMGGNAWFGFDDSAITAAGGTVTIAVATGNISTVGTHTSNVITAAEAVLSAKQIGTAGKALKTAVDSITTTVAEQNGITHVDNSTALTSIAATTAGGRVTINSATADLAFDSTNKNLSVTTGTGTSLAFANTAGDLVLTGINLGSNSLNLNAAGSITQSGGHPLVAGDATLVATKNIGTSTTDLSTQVSSLDLKAGQGGIYISQQGGLTLTAAAKGANSDVRITQTGAGDLDLKTVSSAQGGVTLQSSGSILNAAGPGVTNITGNSATLTAASSIGSDAAPLSTKISGTGGQYADFTATANGAIVVENTGDINLAATTHDAGDITFTNSGGIKLGAVTAGAGHDINLTATGQITDGNGDAANLTAKNLALKAGSVGTSSDSLEIAVEKLTVDTTNGGLYLKQIGSSDLYLAYARSASDTSIEASRDIYLGVVEATGKNVIIKAANGDIIDDRMTGETRPNVRAYALDITAKHLGTQADPLELDINVLNATATEGDTFVENLGSLHVTAGSLTGKGVGQAVSIKASSITVFDNNGGTTTLDNNGSLELIAKNGNIVFLNPTDTVAVTGTGTITLEALGTVLPGGETGLVGVIIAGNLKTAGGNITLKASSHISINLLDAGTGNVTVQSGNGLIIDGNGSAVNIIARNVTLSGKSLSDAQAWQDLSKAIADAGDKNLNLNLQTQQKTYEEQLVAMYASFVSLYQTLYNNSVNDVSAKESAVSSAQSSYDAAYWTFYAAGIAFDTANLVASILEIPAGAAQAIPLVGDGGAALALGIAKAVLAGLQVAAGAAEHAVEAMGNNLSDAEHALITAEAALFSNKQHLDDNTGLLNTHTSILNDLTDKQAKAEYALAASKLLNQLAQKAYDDNNVIGTATQALGIQAERVDATAFGQSNIYIESPGSLGIGNLSAQGIDTTIETTAQGDLNILGQSTSTKDIILYSENGAINGSTSGKLVTGDLVAIAANGVGRGTPLNTQVDRIAASGGTGGARFVNDNGIEPLTIDGISVATSNVTRTVTGVSGADDILIETTGDLILNKEVKDTSGTHTVTLEATGGSITGADIVRHVTGGTLNTTAASGIGTAGTPLRTDVAEIIATVTGDGLINIDEKDAIKLTSVTTENGPITVKAGGDIDAVSVVSTTDAAGNTIDLTATSGDITAGTITAGATHGDITLTATAGQVNNDQNTGTKITGHDLTITAATGIGMAGTDANRSLDTDVASLVANVTGAGDINIAETDDLAVKQVATPDGDITIVSATGSLALTQIAASGAGNTVTLKAAGAITDATDAADTSNKITATNLAAIAGTGIGAADNHLEVQVDNLEAYTATGGIYINDLTGDLTIGDVTPGLGLPALEGVKADEGDVVLTTAGNMVINEIVAALDGDATLDATTGSITGADSLTRHVIADTLTATAATGIGAAGTPLRTDVTELIAEVTGAGLVNIDEKDAIKLTSVTTENGPITINAGGDIDAVKVVSTTDAAGNDIALTATAGNITAGIIGAGHTYGDIALTAVAGQVNNDQNTGTKITGHDLTITAANGIGMTGADANRSLDTNVASLVANVTDAGDINIAEADDLAVKQVATPDGDITIVSATGSLALTQIAASGAGNTVTLKAATAITDATADTSSKVSTDNLALIAGTGIGTSANSLEVRIKNLEAATGAGDIHITNLTGDLTIGDVTPGLGLAALDGVRADQGNIVLTTPGSMIINETVAAPDGDVTLEATAGSITGTGPIPPQYHVEARTLDATAATGIGTADTPLRTNIDNLIAAVTGTGLINLEENDDINLEHVTTADGPVTIKAGGDITIDFVDANGTVTLSSDNGSIITNPGGELTGEGLVIDSGSGIDVDTDVDWVDFTVTGTGDIIIREQSGLDLRNVVTANGYIDVRTGLNGQGVGDITATNVISQTDIDRNDITLHALAGDITIHNVVAGQGQNADVVLIADTGAVSTARPGGNPVVADELDVTAVSGINLETTVNAARLVTTGAGSVVINETDAITLADVTAANGPIDITAGGTVTATHVVSATDSAANHVNITATSGDIIVDLVAAGTGQGGDVTLRADGVIRESTPEDAEADIVGNTVNLHAGGDIGLGDAGALEINSNRLNAYSRDGNITLADTGDVIINELHALNGFVKITAGGHIADDNDDTTWIKAKDLVLEAGTGIGEQGPAATRALDTEARTLSASVTGTGGINIAQSSDGLLIHNASTADGDINIIATRGDIDVDLVTAAGLGNTVNLLAHDGAIRDVRNDDLVNITADNLSLNGSNGVGSRDNLLDVATALITAHGGTGGVYINNLREGLVLAGLDTILGDIFLRTPGLLEINDPLINSGGGDISLTTTDTGADTDYIIINALIQATGGNGSVYLDADDTLIQNAAIRVENKGAVEATAGIDIIMGAGTTTTADLDHITYTAGNRIELGRLIASTQPVGGTVTVQAPVIVNNNPAGLAAIAGAFLKVNTAPGVTKGMVEDLIAGRDTASAIWLNQRLVGGLLSRDPSVIGQPRVDSVTYDIGWRPLYESGYENLPVDESAYAGEGFVRQGNSDIWSFIR